MLRLPIPKSTLTTFANKRGFTNWYDYLKSRGKHTMTKEQLAPYIAKQSGIANIKNCNDGARQFFNTANDL